MGPDVDDERWADLADLLLTVAREIQQRGHSIPGVVAISPSESNVMRFIDRAPGATASQVASGSGLQRSNLSTILRALEEKGLVERRDNAEDGRGVTLFPTALAVKNLALLRREWASQLRAALPSGDPADTNSALTDTVTLLRAIEEGLIGSRPSHAEQSQRPRADLPALPVD